MCLPLCHTPKPHALCMWYEALSAADATALVSLGIGGKLCGSTSKQMTIICVCSLVPEKFLSHLNDLVFVIKAKLFRTLEW